MFDCLSIKHPVDKGGKVRFGSRNEQLIHFFIGYHRLQQTTGQCSASGRVSASVHVIIDEIKSFTGRGFFYSTCQIHFERGQLSLGVERTEKIYDQSIRGVFMLQISTLLLRESCRLSVKNFKFCANLS